MRDANLHFRRLGLAVWLRLVQCAPTHALQPRGNYHASRITFSILIGCFALTAAEIDVTKLPPPAQVTVEFDRDIKPIFEKSCLRCHGPTKQRSQLRVDTRAALLGCLLIGIVCTVAFVILGVPYALLLGALAGFLEHGRLGVQEHQVPQ